VRCPRLEKSGHEHFHLAAAEVVKRAAAGKAVSARISLGANSAYSRALFEMGQACVRLNRTISQETPDRHISGRSALTCFHPFESQR
jgi:hypothetical protein